MSGRPWGRTGRVTLVPWGHSDGVKVIVDRSLVVGDLWWQERSPWGPVWIALPDWQGARNGEPILDRDDAVMWVLRRAAPEVWRAERPVVWRVYRTPAGVWARLRSRPGPLLIGTTTHEAAVRAADALARAEYADYVRTTR